MNHCTLFASQGSFSSLARCGGGGKNAGKWNGALAVCFDRSYQCCTADGEME